MVWVLVTTVVIGWGLSDVGDIHGSQRQRAGKVEIRYARVSKTGGVAGDQQEIVVVGHAQENSGVGNCHPIDPLHALHIAHVDDIQRSVSHGAGAGGCGAVAVNQIEACR